MACCYLILLSVVHAQESVSPQTGVAERAFPYKALPIELWVERGTERLPLSRVPELAVGDNIKLKVDLEAPELSSLSASERQRLRDWSIGWFLTTPEGSLVYDSTRRGQTDRGRIDLTRGENELTIQVVHERQKFPIFFFVRTRTLESWEEIRRTRQTKASNFVDHFGRYSEVVGDYQNLQVFLTSLQRESPQAETLEERLSAGFGQLGFTVDSKMRLGDPTVVAKLLGELEASLGTQSQTFQAQAAGKMLSQMIDDSNLGIIGAAASIGGFLYRVTDYSESYHWSSARLQEQEPGRYQVMSSERIRHGEAELAPDGSSRNNVRSILVCTPVSRQAAAAPRLFWSSDAPNSLTPSQSQATPEVRISQDSLSSKTDPNLVQRYFSPEAKAWDSLHGENSPLKARISESGHLELQGLDKLWASGELSAEVKVSARWGFQTVPVASFTALRSSANNPLTLPRAPYLLSQGQKYRLELTTATPIAVGKARFAGKEVKIALDESPPRLLLDTARAPVGPVQLEIYAGQSYDPSHLLLSQEFWVVSSSAFHAVLPEGSSRLELVTKHNELLKALDRVTAVKVGETIFSKEHDSLIFEAPLPPHPFAAEKPKAELLFQEHGSVPDVHLDIPRRPRGVELELYPQKNVKNQAYDVELWAEQNRLLARGAGYEFRLRSNSNWPSGSELTIEVEQSEGSITKQRFAALPQSDQALLRSKRDVLFGNFTPQETGRVSYRPHLPVEDSKLRLEWTEATEWEVVELPDLVSITALGDGEFEFEGRYLDLTISAVYSSSSASEDPHGSPLERLANGRYRLLLEGFDPKEFWIELGDLEQTKRFRVTPSNSRR